MDLHFIMWGLSSWIKDRTCVSCISRQILDHWPSKEVPSSPCLLIQPPSHRERRPEGGGFSWKMLYTSYSGGKNPRHWRGGGGDHMAKQLCSLKSHFAHSPPEVSHWTTFPDGSVPYVRWFNAWKKKKRGGRNRFKGRKPSLGNPQRVKSQKSAGVSCGLHWLFNWEMVWRWQASNWFFKSQNPIHGE